MLTGCTFFSHNTERDLQQVVATVESYEIKNSVRDENDETKIVTYTTTAKEIYKYDLVEYVNNSGSQLSQQFQEAKDLYKYALNLLVNTELVINEVDALIDAGLIKWDLTQTNAVKKRVYTSIDSTIMSLKNDILKEHDKEQITTEGDSEVSTDTTYPVKEEEENEDETTGDVTEWQPDRSRNPYVSNDADELSLGKEALNRLISLLNNRVKDDFRVTDEDKKKFEEDNNNIQKIINEQGYEYVYPMLGSTHLVYYITGKTIEKSQKITALQKYLTDSVTVSDEEVQKSFTDTLNTQKSSFTEKPDDFKKAVTDNNTVLYYPNNDFFYVKHILLGFSDEQKNHLEEYKKTHTKDEIKQECKRMADALVCYPHVAGEDDKSKPMTVERVMNEVLSVMNMKQANIKEADLAFDDLIYKYNTDPGAFNNNKGYAVNIDKASNNWMEEFTEGALYMRENMQPGQVYSEPVITEYGVHIMYFASVTKVGAVEINDYTTPGELQTYYDLLEEPIRTQRENNEYTKWENNVLMHNYDSHVELFEDRYSNLWE